MAELGRFALLIGIFLSSYSILADLLGTWRKDNGLLESGRNATMACLGCLTIAIVALLSLLVQSDFSVNYVAEHTSKALPLAYKYSALWAGAAGSLLLWLWLQVGFVVVAFCGPKPNQKVFSAHARAIANLVSVFFLIVMIMDKNPFEAAVVAPADGAGLNPLLQHPAMVLHPPTLFIGYAAFAIPFAWAIASMKYDNRLGPVPLFRQARNWILWAWLFLTVGIALGAWWAYEELGWGGYWAWDPVENSSLMPWLAATALLHSARTYKARSATGAWMIVLSLLTFSLCIFGTFLTRYGLVSSVHAFPEPGLGIMFIVLLIHIWIIAAIIAVHRRLRHGHTEPAAVGPGLKYIIYNNWLMIILTFVIFIGTLFPFLSGLVTEQKISLKPEYFNKITTPGGLLLLLLLSVCPYLLRYGLRANRRIIGAGIAIIAAVGAWFITRKFAIPCFIISGFALLSLAADVIGYEILIAERKNKGAPLRRSLRWYGSRIVHLGVVLAFIGMAGSDGYGLEEEKVLQPGQTFTLGNFKMVYEDIKADHGPNFTAVTANMSVYKYSGPGAATPDAKDTSGTQNLKLIAQLTPSRAVYSASGKIVSEVDIHRTLAGDLYLALTDLDSGSKLIRLTVLVKPLINWIWIGSTVMILGTVLVLISYHRKKTTVSPD
jgi:cytochrome c-type biogenesis protein CcmF